VTRQQELLDKLMTGLDLEFKDATGEEEDGWYVWRNREDWPVDEYQIFEIADGMMDEPEPYDSYGALFCMQECKPYGQLAGPILGR